VPGLPQYVNADIEQGHLGWTESPSTTIIAQLTGYPAHSRQWVAWLGGEGSTDEVSLSIPLPTGSPLYVRFYYLVRDSSTAPDLGAARRWAVETAAGCEGIAGRAVREAGHAGHCCRRVQPSAGDGLVARARR
jgi:hypothetical protein